MCYNNKQYNRNDPAVGSKEDESETKMKKFFAEFKAFALKGNVLDLSVAVIIGAAFQAIINSVVKDLINPLLSLILKADFSGLFIPLQKTVDVANEAGEMVPVSTDTMTLAELEAAGAGVFKYGAFINAVINFVIMALVIFLLVKGINKLTNLGKKEEEPAAPTTKKCPFCMSEVDINATRCAHCTSQLEVPEIEEKKSASPNEKKGVFSGFRKNK